MTHNCPAPGCTRKVGFTQLMCRLHWFMVPKNLRAAVWDAYHGPGMGSPEHSEAVEAAVAAVTEKLSRS